MSGEENRKLVHITGDSKTLTLPNRPIHWSQVFENEDGVGGASTGDAHTTSEWSTIATKVVGLILQV